MQPVEELTEQLFKNCPERVQLRSYRHVVPSDAILPLAISKGPTGKELLFNYNNRQSKDLVRLLLFYSIVLVKNIYFSYS